MFDPKASYEYSQIKPETIEKLNDYGRGHIPPGGFLTACLANDFMEAACRADDDNALALREIAIYIYNELPRDCHGSYERVKAWTARPAAAKEPVR